MDNKLYVIDISNIIHRAFYAVSPLSTSAGFPTNAIKGTLNIMLKFIRENKPSHIILCCDSPSKNGIRVEMYPQYKANRGHTETISAQEFVIFHMLELLGIKRIVAPRYEADDLIATITNKFKIQIPVTIVTGDKDLLQLVGLNVVIYDGMKKRYMTHEDVKKKFGVEAHQISDYLAIVGDKCDNIPGAQGIGPKGAQKLLYEYGSINGIYENISNIKGSIQDKLIKSKDIVYLSKKLTNLYDIGCTENLEHFRFKPEFNDELIKLLKKLEFNGYEEKLGRIWLEYKNKENT
jgi:5'-3' exonuclease